MRRRKYTDLDAFRSAVCEGTQPPAGALVKTLLGTIEPVADSRAIRFTISTESQDRQGDIIEAKGWKLDSFRRNPVVLWSHDYSQPPIAKATDLQVVDGRLVATAEFIPASISPFAETIYQMVKGGYLNGTSVGFKPIKVRPIDPEKTGLEAAFGGVRFVEQELLEFSVVPIPANPEALVEARAAGIDVEPVLAWAEDILADHSPDKVLVPRDALAAVVKALGPRQTEPDGQAVVVEPVKVAPVAVQTHVQPVEKAGRVLSAANEQKLRAATGAIRSAIDALDAVLAQVAPPADEPASDDEDEDEVLAQPAPVTKEQGYDLPEKSDDWCLEVVDAEAVLEMTASVEPVQMFEFDPAVLTSSLKDSINALLAEAIGTRVERTVRALRGRID